MMVQKKILVVDDEKDIVELISYNLEQEGFAVIKAYDGQMAWERVKNCKTGPGCSRSDDFRAFMV